MSAQSHSRVSLYDVLGVEPDASPETIKQAWREATDKFEPGTGSGQFQLFNQAADTLLDPTRRAQYDAELDDEPTAPVGRAATEPTTTAAPVPAASAEPATERAGASPAAGEVEHETAPEVVEPRRSRPVRAGLTRGWVVLVTVLLVLAVAAVVAAAIFFSKERSDAATDDASQEASAAAERSLGPVLSYDYRRLKADRARAVPFLSASYRKEYTATFDQLIEATTAGQPGPAEKAQAVVKAEVTNVGVADAEPDRVRLVVFLNQSTTKNGGDPSFSLNRLGVSMVKSGSSWLVDNIVSY